MLFGIGVNALVEVGEDIDNEEGGIGVVVTEKGTGVVERGEIVCVGSMLPSSGTKTNCSGGESAYLKRANISATLQPSRS